MATAKKKATTKRKTTARKKSPAKKAAAKKTAAKMADIGVFAPVLWFTPERVKEPEPA